MTCKQHSSNECNTSSIVSVDDVVAEIKTLEKKSEVEFRKRMMATSRCQGQGNRKEGVSHLDPRSYFTCAPNCDSGGAKIL